MSCRALRTAAAAVRSRISQLVYRPPMPFLGRSGSKPHLRGFSSSWGRDSFQELGQSGKGWDGSNTIYALSTAPGKSAIAVVRISGPACMDVRLTGSLFGCFLPLPRCILPNILYFIINAGESNRMSLFNPSYIVQFVIMTLSHTFNLMG